jgi:hypothetical protein
MGTRQQLVCFIKKNIMTTKETLLKNHALSEWLSSYDFDKPIEVYDALV